MSLRGSKPDPYTESGGFASVQEVRRMRRESLASSRNDAHDLRRRGEDVIRRGARESLLALAGMLVSGVLVFAMSAMAVRSHDGSYEGAVTSNWSMLGTILAVGGLYVSWGWFTSRRRLRETGERLIRRAEYQHHRATLQLTEAEDETLC
jgi:hypothetical protein